MQVLNQIYRNVDIGIIGIEEVVKKVSDSCLEKLMLDQKKEYMVIRSDVNSLLEEYEVDPKQIGLMMRLSNDLYTNMKLLKEDNDSVIAKMMLEGTNKSILEITSLLHAKDYKNDAITKILERLLDILEYNEKELKKYL